MRFPVTIRHRSSKAKIYAPAGKFKYYRLAYTTAGKRRMQTFAAYSDAKAAAERIVRDLASGSQAAALSASQSRDALSAFEQLDGHFKSKGKCVSLNTAVADWLAGFFHRRARCWPAVRQIVPDWGAVLAAARRKWKIAVTHRAG